MLEKPLPISFLLSYPRRMLTIAFILQLWGGNVTSDARAIADAIVWAVERDPVHVWGEHEDAAILAEWAKEESGVQLHPRPYSQDAVSGVSCGPWQQGCIRASARTARELAAMELADLHEGQRICPWNPAAPLSGGCSQARGLADRRVLAALASVATTPR